MRGRLDARPSRVAHGTPWPRHFSSAQHVPVAPRWPSPWARRRRRASSPTIAPPAGSDLELKGQIEQALLDESSALAERINVDVFIGRVMLTGVVPDEAARSTATRVTRRIAGEVYDDIEVGASGVSDTAEEIATNKTLGVNLLAGEGLASQSLLHRVVNRTAFIMGEVREEGQIDTVRSVAQQTPGVWRVVTHIVLEQ
jgi:osmotically-inducible protein OsmY